MLKGKVEVIELAPPAVQTSLTPAEVLVERILFQCYEGGHLPIDNNRAENATRPFVIGRKTGCSTTRPKVPPPVRSSTA